MFNRCYALKTTDSLNCTISMNVLFMIMRINAESISNNGLQNLLYLSLLHIYHLFPFFFFASSFCIIADYAHKLYIPSFKSLGFIRWEGKLNFFIRKIRINISVVYCIFIFRKIKMKVCWVMHLSLHII